MRLFDIFKKGLTKSEPPTGHQTIISEKETHMQVGQPANYPTEIVASLQALFADAPEVQKGYLGWIFDPESGDPPHLIIALDIQSESSSIIQRAGPIAQKFLNPGEIIDFIRIVDDGGISDYFTKETKPFFDQKNDQQEYIAEASM